MSLFDQIAEAELIGKKPRFVPGNYRLIVDKVDSFESRNKGGMFVIECTVVSYEPSEDETSNSVAIGSQVAQVIKLSLDSAAQNIKGFILAAAAAKAREAGVEGGSGKLTAKDVERCVGPKSIIVGVNVGCNAFNADKKDGGTYVHLNWSA